MLSHLFRFGDPIDVTNALIVGAIFCAGGVFLGFYSSLVSTRWFSFRASVASAYRAFHLFPDRIRSFETVGDVRIGIYAIFDEARVTLLLDSHCSAFASLGKIRDTYLQSYDSFLKAFLERHAVAHESKLTLGQVRQASVEFHFLSASAVDRIFSDLAALKPNAISLVRLPIPFELVKRLRNDTDNREGPSRSIWA